MYDFIIKNGLVFDGLGNKPEEESVAVKNGQIVDVGVLSGQKAKIEINANKKFVSPGFIEINSLADRDCSLLYHPEAVNFLSQGVTTVIGGASGASLAPILSGSLDCLEKWVDSRKININWRTVAEFLNYLAEKRLGVNFGMLVSWATLRSEFAKREFRSLNQEEKEKLKFLVEQSLNDGAWGVSFGLGYDEEQVVSIEEILEIADLVKKRNGYLGFSLRDETERFLASLQEVLEIVERGKVSLEIYQLKTVGEYNHLHFRDGLEMIKSVNREQEFINFDISPYNLAITPLLSLLPDWVTIGGRKVFLRNLHDEVIKNKIIQDLKQKKYHYHYLFVAASEKSPWFVGKTIEELAHNFGLSEEEVVLKILEVSGTDITIINKDISEENTKLALESNYSFVSSSSGFSELSSYQSWISPQAWGTFPKFLAEYVRENKQYSWEEAIFKLTGKPARKIGLKNRGIIKKGYQADLVIFDPEKIEGRANLSNPQQLPVGIDSVMVNGKLAFDKGRVIPMRAGKILQKS